MSDAGAATSEETQSSNGAIDHERLAGLVHAFISMMNAGNIARLDLDYRDLRISLRAQGEPASTGAVVQRVVTPQVVVETTAAPQSTDDHHVIAAPMIGTFYTAPAPSEPPFIKPGDRIEEGQTIGIIEAMKIMNEIAADRAGTVIEVVAKNAQSVEFGSPLVTLAPDGP